MKFRKLLLKTMPVIVISTGIVSSITSCANTNGMPKITSHEVKNVFIKLLHQRDDGSYYYALSPYGQVEVHEFNNLHIGYVDVDEYVNNLMQFKDTYGDEYANYSSNTANGKTIITNHGTNATATIDYEKQTITFTDYDKFGCNELAYKDNPLAEGAGGGEAYFKDKDTGVFLYDSVYIEGGEYVIDLSKYNIKAYYDNDHGYLPNDIFRNIFNRSTETHLFYNGVALYEVCQSNSSFAVDLYKDIAAEATILTKDYMEYCYNLFALTLDHKFGLQERLSRAPATKGQIKKFMPNGAYDMLAQYKDGLTSLDPDVANDTLFTIFRDIIDDGGHAGYGGVNLLSTAPHESARGPEKTQTFDTQDMMEYGRQLAAIKGEKYIAGPTEYWANIYAKSYGTLLPDVIDNYMYLYGEDEDKPILYITFDAFNHVEKYTTYEEAVAGKVLYDDVDYELTSTSTGNYMLDTIRMTMGADKFIKDYNAKTEHQGTKAINNIVLDLSNNGGGTVYTEHFIASWLCGGVTEKIWNPHTKAYAEYRIQADVDGDGKFTTADYLSAETNVFCITSDTSFSCGNMLPCNLVDNRMKSTAADNHTFFIGSPSGGGACFVDSAMHLGLGNVFRSSSTFHMLRGASTKDNKISVESGHLPVPTEGNGDFVYYIPSTWANCEKFFDRETINTEIRKNV